MTNQSGIATSEIHQIINPTQKAIQEIIQDEPELKLCHGCGEPDTKETCLCDAKTKIRLVISEILKAYDLEWNSNDVLACDEHELQIYTYIGFCFSPSRQFMLLLKEAGIINYAECGNCHDLCTPNYLSGVGNKVEPLCLRCANEFYGH